MASNFLVIESKTLEVDRNIPRKNWINVLNRVVKITLRHKNGEFSSVGLIADKETVFTTSPAVLSRESVNVKYCQHGGIVTAGPVAPDPQNLSASIYPWYVPSVSKIDFARNIDLTTGDSLLVVNHHKEDWGISRFVFNQTTVLGDLEDISLDCPEGVVGAPVFSNEQKLIGVILGQIPLLPYYLVVPWGVHFRNRADFL